LKLGYADDAVTVYTGDVIELNPDYLPLIVERCQSVPQSAAMEVA
jgi:hypothetical protein